jgi:hypothetical protein
MRPMADLSEFERGFLAGLLAGEGSFGGDGRQPQVTLRMHTRRETIFCWLQKCFPDSRLYGPYHHGGRSYFQWMARGRVLVRDLLPLLERDLRPEIDSYTRERLDAMLQRYSTFIARERERDRARRATDGQAP